MIKAVILDFYGVLFSNFDWEVIEQRIKSNPEKARRFEELKSQSNRGEITNRYLQTAVADLAGDAAHPDKPAVYAKPYFNHDLVDYITGIEPKLKIGLLSNGNRGDVKRELHKNGRMKHLDAVITSSDHQFEKPQREAYKSMFKALDVKPKEAVIIDDSQRHVFATDSYGFDSIHYFNEMDFESEFRRFLDEKP
ncbi:MAG TPA: HAD-IA family hydrolase [Candidatus Saccharimonadales bacterium]